MMIRWLVDFAKRFLSRWTRPLGIAFSALLLLGITGEVLLRLYAPTLSYKYSLLKASSEFADLPEAAILEQISYRAGPGLSIYGGLIGAGLMVIAAIYPMFRRLRMFRWMASNTISPGCGSTVAVPWSIWTPRRRAPAAKGRRAPGQ